MWSKTVEDFLSQSFLSSSTRQRYHEVLNEFGDWYRNTYGEEPLAQLLTDEELREWREHLVKSKLKAATVNLRLSAVRSLARANGRELKTRGVRQSPRPVEPLSGRDLGRLLAALNGERWIDKRNVAIVSLMARAGLRVGEIVALDTDDVELAPRSGWVTVRHGKGLKERRVPLSVEARRAIRAYLDARPDWAGSLRPLFVTKTGHRLKARDVQRLVTKAATTARLRRRVTPHILRHTFATRFLRGGGDLATLQALLGHANISTTSRYLHPDAARVQEMVENL